MWYSMAWNMNGVTSFEQKYTKHVPITWKKLKGETTRAHPNLNKILSLAGVDPPTKQKSWEGVLRDVARRNYPVKHIPTYEDEKELNMVLNKIKNFPPLVFAGETRHLKQQQQHDYCIVTTQ